jgi:hypothetical protein
VAELGFGVDAAKAESLYKINLTSALQAVLASAEFQGISKCLEDMRVRYANGNPELLFYGSGSNADLTFNTKPFQSTIDKLYRRNVVYNRNYPNPPNGRVVSATELYESIDDLIRSRIICKYMDGPPFVCKSLEEYCASVGISCNFRDVSTEAGYYAWHFYFRIPVELSICSDVVTRSISVEIQFSTQLAEAISALTHGLYEERRTGAGSADDRGWRWDASSQRFRSTYIGHGLHLLEGMIQTFRDDVLGIGAAAAQSEDGGRHRLKDTGGANGAEKLREDRNGN